MDDAGQGLAIIYFDIIGQMVGVERGAGIKDVFANRFIVAIDQVRQIGTRFAADPAKLMALVTSHGIAKKYFPAPQPIAACQFGNVPLARLRN